MSTDVTDLIRAYLARTGWAVRSRGPAGTLWRHDGQGRDIAVADAVTYGSPEWQGVITRLGRHESRKAPAIAADIIGRPGEESALTCECCKAAPATHLLVADFPKIKRVTKLACGPCGGIWVADGNGGQAPTLVRLYMITEVTD